MELKGLVKDLLGETVISQTKIGYRTVLKTNEGVFTNYEEFVELLDKEYYLRQIGKKIEEYEVFEFYVKEDSMYGYLLTKNDSPLIFSTYIGDDRGAIYFNNTFIVSGHDGTFLFNVNNPFEMIYHS